MEESSRREYKNPLRIRPAFRERISNHILAIGSGSEIGQATDGTIIEVVDCVGEIKERSCGIRIVSRDIGALIVVCLADARRWYSSDLT